MRKKSILFTTFYLVALVGILNYIANLFYFYWTVWWFDILMHLLGGVAIGLLSIWLLSEMSFLFKRRVDRDQVIMTSLITVIIVGIAWEVFEYIFRLTDLVNNYGLDVFVDLVADTCGALLAGLIGSRYG